MSEPKSRRPRVTKKKLEAAAELAKEHGLRVQVGNVVFEPASSEASRDADEAALLEARFKSEMGGGRAPGR